MPLQDGWHLAEPLITFVVVGVLAGALWWMLWPQAPRVTPLAADDDYGLLEVAAYADRFAAAVAVRRFLAGAGIRATVAIGRDARIRILVFPEDLQRARDLVQRAQDEPDGFTSPGRHD